MQTWRGRPVKTVAGLVIGMIPVICPIASAGLFEGAPKLEERWRRPIGSGYSAVSVADGRVFTMANGGDDDYIVALDADSGKELWRRSVGAAFLGRDGSHDGPLSTPTADGRRIFALSPRGRLLAHAADDGRLLWDVDLVSRFQAVAPDYGFTSAPLIDGDRLVVVAGGPEAQLIAFEKTTGKVVWARAHGQGSSYASPVIASLAGVRQIVVPAGDRIYGVEPENGGLLWSYDEAPFASFQVGSGDRLMLAFFVGVAMIGVHHDGDAWQVEERWRNPGFRSPYSPVVFHAAATYGFDGLFLTSLDATNGELRWRRRIYDGSVTAVDDHLAVLGRTSGQLRIVEATAEDFRERARAGVFQPGATSFTPPAFAGERFYLRNLEEIVAFDVVGYTSSEGKP